jgi:tRNA 2-thiouridine synthesizing protein D|tara:strand:+ start:1613 stop:2053 length:441 start_codon:yes stop_codon:yes gene_type:complete
MSDLNTLVPPSLNEAALTYTIVVRCGADQQSQALSAFRFTQQVLSQGHRVLRVFFYQQGVHWSSGFRVMPQDELNITALWQQLSLDYGIELGVCIAAALQSGIVDPQESIRYELGGENLASQFMLVGLGQLAAASVESDRLVSFGG